VEKFSVGVHEKRPVRPQGVAGSQESSFGH
jgi:hypothetical protein